MLTARSTINCPTCGAVANPRWSSCLACGAALEEAQIDADIICFFCGEPVEIGTPGTGALAGEALHMSCYERSSRPESNRGKTGND